MQDKDKVENQGMTNVVSIFKAREPLSPEAGIGQDTDAQVDLFKETMRKNAENKKRLSQDRNKANHSVLRSYRIKK